MAPEDQDGGRSFAIRERISIIGRAPLNEIVLDEPGVSRRHASIRRDYRGWWIADLGSRNGTFVNGKRLSDEPIQLRESDHIEFGRSDGQVQWVFLESEGNTGILRLIKNGPGSREPATARATRSHMSASSSPVHREASSSRHSTIIYRRTAAEESSQLIPLPRGVLLAILGALLGGEAIIILLLIHLVLRASR